MILLCLEIEKVFGLATDKWKRKTKKKMLGRSIPFLVSSHVSSFVRTQVRIHVNWLVRPFASGQCLFNPGLLDRTSDDAEVV